MQQTHPRWLPLHCQTHINVSSPSFAIDVQMDESFCVRWILVSWGKTLENTYNYGSLLRGNEEDSVMVEARNPSKMAPTASLLNI
jgi:hypothetical protein